MRRALAGAAMIFVAALAAPIYARTAVPHLIDQNGRTFSLQSLRGTPLAVTFVSAHCTDACPLIDGQFARVAESVKAQHLRLHLLTITLDPERDSPATMRHLAHLMHADASIWTIAGGRLADVHAVMNAFGVVARRGRKGYADVHTTFVYVLDSKGRLRQTMLASNHLDTMLLAQVKRQWAQLTS